MARTNLFTVFLLNISKMQTKITLISKELIHLQSEGGYNARNRALRLKAIMGQLHCSTNGRIEVFISCLDPGSTGCVIATVSILGAQKSTVECGPGQFQKGFDAFLRSGKAAACKKLVPFAVLVGTRTIGFFSHIDSRLFMRRTIHFCGCQTCRNESARWQGKDSALWIDIIIHGCPDWELVHFVLGMKLVLT